MQELKFDSSAASFHQRTNVIAATHSFVSGHVSLAKEKVKASTGVVPLSSNLHCSSWEGIYFSGQSFLREAAYCL